MAFRQAIKLEPLPGTSYDSPVQEDPSRKQQNKIMRERVSGQLHRHPEHFVGQDAMEVKIKAAKGFPYEHWMIPFGVDVSIPRYLAQHINANLKVHEFKTTELKQGQPYAVPRVLREPVQRASFDVFR